MLKRRCKSVVEIGILKRFFSLATLLFTSPLLLQTLQSSIISSSMNLLLLLLYIPFVLSASSSISHPHTGVVTPFKPGKPDVKLGKKVRTMWVCLGIYCGYISI
jgi:hypothetical protein